MESRLEMRINILINRKVVLGKLLKNLGVMTKKSAKCKHLTITEIQARYQIF